MASEDQVVPCIPSPYRREYHATVEHVDEAEWGGYSSSSSDGPTELSSRNSPEDADVEANDIEQVVPEASLCRRNTAEMSTSLWGMVPPKNFGRVMSGVYRSAFPERENITFLKNLGLKSILTLVPAEYTDQHNRFLEENGIYHFRVSIQANKKPNLVHSQTNMVAALSTILDRSNHPILIHCNQGKHRTGCVVGCLRKVMGWAQRDLFAEYHSYAGVKARALDEIFMDRFDERALLWQARNNHFIPLDVPIAEFPVPTLAVSTRLRG